MLMLGMRLSWTYDSVRRFTKSTQKLSTLSVAVSKCFDFSGLEVIMAILLILLLVLESLVVCAAYRAETSKTKDENTRRTRGCRRLNGGWG